MQKPAGDHKQAFFWVRICRLLYIGHRDLVALELQEQR